MLKIKLQPTGKRHQRYYRIVVAQDKSKLSGNVVDILGSYNPHDEKNTITVDKNNYQSWISKGAQPTNTIKNLIKNNK